MPQKKVPKPIKGVFPEKKCVGNRVSSSAKMQKKQAKWTAAQTFVPGPLKIIVLEVELS